MVSNLYQGAQVARAALSVSPAHAPLEAAERALLARLARGRRASRVAVAALGALTAAVVGFYAARFASPPPPWGAVALGSAVASVLALVAWGLWASGGAGGLARDLAGGVKEVYPLTVRAVEEEADRDGGDVVIVRFAETRGVTRVAAGAAPDVGARWRLERTPHGGVVLAIAPE